MKFHLVLIFRILYLHFMMTIVFAFIFDKSDGYRILVIVLASVNLTKEIYQMIRQVIYTQFACLKMEHCILSMILLSYNC